MNEEQYKRYERRYRFFVLSACAIGLLALGWYVFNFLVTGGF
jgi:hypothetical protein